jgi:hypothetical protein
VRRVKATFGAARLGSAWLAFGAVRHGLAERGSPGQSAAVHGWLGEAMHGVALRCAARPGVVRPRWQGTAGRGLARHGGARRCWLGLAWQGVVEQSMAWRCRAWLAWLGNARLCYARLGGAGLRAARLAWLGRAARRLARPGEAWRGAAGSAGLRAARHGTAWHGWHGLAWLGGARLGAAGQRPAWRGGAVHGRLGSDGRGLARPVLARLGQAERGPAWPAWRAGLGMAGKAGRGRAVVGSARQCRALLCWRGEAWPGDAKPGRALSGLARQRWARPVQAVRGWLVARRRRNFTQSDKVAIVGRASDASGRIHCERCGAWCRKRADYEIDHVLAEGMRPAADLLRPLCAADGQLLCTATCHPKKTVVDKNRIAKAVRLEAAERGVRTPPARKINWGHEREDKPKLKVAAGKPRIAREYGQ